MKAEIASYKKLDHLELSISIELEDVQTILPELDLWSCEHVIAMVARNHKEILYAGMLQTIEKYGKELFPRTEVNSQTPEISE
tara:strand:- start:2619 stop:2867 length:249 start_codon:yes stop_codon:yes gene_type:complete